MKQGKDSELISLIRGESGSLWPTRPERRLLKFALDKFGVPLSQMLLSGLGEECEAHRWLFTITFTHDSDMVLRRRLHIEADDSMPESQNFLPCRREPLVMLALLWLLIRDGRKLSDRLDYDQEEVLSLLGWPYTEESQRLINESVERYSFLTYRCVLSKKELTIRNLSFCRYSECFISGYGQYYVEKGPQVQLRRLANHVNFNIEFVKQLMSRSLLGIDWNNVSSLKRSSYHGAASSRTI